jgi:hypothetical protein
MKVGSSDSASTFGDLQWTATGERLTARNLPAKYRKIGGDVVLHSIPEDMVQTARNDIRA